MNIVRLKKANQMKDVVVIILIKSLKKDKNYLNKLLKMTWNQFVLMQNASKQDMNQKQKWIVLILLYNNV